MTGHNPIRGRLAELLADEATDAMEREGQEELERLLAQAPTAGRDDMMTTAALGQLAFLKGDGAARRAMPESLRHSLARQGDAWMSGRQVTVAAPVADLERVRRSRDSRRRSSAAPVVKPARNGFAAMGWYAAAALALAFLVFRLGPNPTAPAPVAAIQRAELLEQAPDVVRTDWGRSAAPGFEKATGDVVWSGARQQGYLRLAGLPPNDPSREQYQLWVVDPERDAHPVDGGVFDISASGEVIVPIRAKLRVGRPTAFAVTLEKAGGVVVSDGPMLLVAAVGG